MPPRFRVEFDNAFVNGNADILVAKVRYGANVHPTIRDCDTIIAKIFERYPGTRLQIVPHSKEENNWTLPGRWFNSSEKIDNPAARSKRSYEEDDEFSMIDAEDLDYFDVMIRPDDDDAGGAGTHNDCLFECIYDHFKGKLLKGPPTAMALKEALELKRDDKVHIKLLPKVERMYGVSFSVTGDAAHESKKACDDHIELTLIAGHYAFKKKTKKTPVIWIWNSDKTATLHTAGGATTVERISMFKKLKDSKDRDCKEVCRRADRIFGKKGKSVENQMTQWQTERKSLLPHGVDLFATPTYAAAAVREFALLSGKLELHPIPFVQQVWLSKAAMGGLVWAATGFEGKAYQYDFNSYYPSLLQTHTFPNQAGDFHELKGKPKTKDGRAYWAYGIYRLKAPLPAPRGVHLWRTHHTQYYTHYDLETYEKLTGIAPELAHDGDNNALLWPPAKTMRGSVAFGEFVKKWYDLKLKKVPGAKLVLTSLWGALCQKHHNTRWVRRGQRIEPVTFTESGSVRPSGEGYEIATRPADQIYSGAAPAIGCFLMAIARSKLATVLTQLDGEVVRIATDSFAVTKPLPEKLIGMLSPDIGCLKLEHDSVLTVKNVNSVEWS